MNVKRIIRICQLLAAIIMLVGTLNWLSPQWVQSVSNTIGGGAHVAGNAITSGQNWVGAQTGPTPTGGTGGSGASPVPTSGVPITFLPSRAPTAVSVPVAPPTAAPTALPSEPVVVGTQWTSGDCNSFELVMQKDYDLDTQAETTNPAYAAFYAKIAAQWASVLQYMAQGPCNGYPNSFHGGLPLSTVACTDPVAWFTAARKTHLDDLNAVPHQAPADWDNYWISWYSRLITAWTNQPGCV